MKITAESIKSELPPSNDKKPKNKKPKDKKSMCMRDKIIVGGIIVATIVGMVVVKIVFFPTSKAPVVVDKQDDKPKENENKPKEPVTEGTSDVMEEAKGGIERPDDAISAEASADGKSRLQEGLDYLISIKDESFIPTRCAAWQNTIPEKARQVQAALSLGYTMDVANSQWFNSNATQKNVYQFVVKMHKDGESDIAFSGNYVTGTRSISISVRTGDFNDDQFASPGGGQQALDPGTE